MGVVRYISHPSVVVDPAVPVERWSLSEPGRAALAVLVEQPWIGALRRIVSSDETKATETAAAIAARAGIAVEVRADTGEIDRRAAGFLPPAEFEVVADRCFANPTERIRGWEAAADAQARIARALEDLFGDADGAGADLADDVAVVGHGGVGTLWWCHLAGEPIARRWDQPSQGHWFAVDRVTRRPLHHWVPFDAASPG